MVITIPRQLTKEQYIKLFSNPVSGIVCDFGVVTNAENWDFIKNIRYSKSMLLGALKFWLEYTEKYYKKIKRIYHPLIDNNIKIHNTLMNFQVVIGMVKGYPDSYLFSHRFIRPLSQSKYSNSLKIQHKLLQDKLRVDMIEFQQGSLQPYFKLGKYNELGLKFTVFPNEHPYIQKQKITRVGVTDKGNVFVLHKKGSGARSSFQAPNKDNIIWDKEKIFTHYKKQGLWNKDIAQTVIPDNPTSRILRGLLETWSDKPLFGDDEDDS